jgi:hypothetical protein
MLKAWIENNNIFLSEDETVSPSNAIEVPDNIRPSDLKILDGKIVFKTQEEKEQEQLELDKKRLLQQLFQISKKLLSKYPEAESKSWVIKVEECRQIINSNNFTQDTYPIIESELLAYYGSIPDIDTIIQYCQRIISKETSYKKFSGTIAGLRNKLESITSISEITNIETLMNNLKTEYGIE